MALGKLANGSGISGQACHYFLEGVLVSEGDGTGNEIV
jgi:hypothetical protein